MRLRKPAAVWPVLLFGVLGTVSPAAVGADSFELEVGLEARLFAHDGSTSRDRLHQSVSVQGEYVADTGDASRFVFAPFARLDAVDDKRTHADVRELFWSVLDDTWELSLGFKQVFWGVTEFNHLVDIINQTDLVENIDGEDKLGQPMAHLSLLRDWGTVDLFVMSGFRERTFPGRDGRLRQLLVIDDDRARYESGARRARVDVAGRWSHQVGGLDLGIYHFSGTGRAPDFEVASPTGAPPVLVPVYAVIDQTGLDAQYLAGNWAYKLEAIRRSGQGDRFWAASAGLEYTVVGVFATQVDLGLVAEYFHDERDAAAFDTLFEHDYAIGLRLGFNDAEDSQALIGLIRDRHSGETVISVEGSRRFGDRFALRVEGRLFTGADAPKSADPVDWLTDGDNRAAFLEREDYLQLELTWFP